MRAEERRSVARCAERDARNGADKRADHGHEFGVDGNRTCAAWMAVGRG